MSEQYRSRVYTDRPEYADFDSPAKNSCMFCVVFFLRVPHVEV